MNATFSLIIFFFILVAPILKAPAMGDEIEIKSDSPWYVCEKAIEKVEKEKRVPVGLLHALSLTKSGRYNQQNSMVKAWPWTISLNGLKFIFSTQKEAANEVHALFAEGWNNLKVGCLQNTLRDYDLTFPNIISTFDPILNAESAANRLNRIYQDGYDWQTTAELFDSKEFISSKYYQNTILPPKKSKTALAKKNPPYQRSPIDFDRTTSLNHTLKKKRAAQRKTLKKENPSILRQTQLNAWRANRTRPEALGQLLAVRIAENAKRQEMRLKKPNNKEKQRQFLENRKNQLSTWRTKLKTN